MTTLAQLHDCHSCNDERSIVQNKNRVLVLSQEGVSKAAIFTRPNRQ